METPRPIKETWLSRKPSAEAFYFTLLITLFFMLLGLIYQNNVYDSHSWMAATGNAIFTKGEVWKLWTTLFAHGDFGHFLGNALLFIPLTFLLTSYYSPLFFPLIGLLLGGIVNFFVLMTLPKEVALIGMSGVIYWMGSAWLTLYILIDRRYSLRHRLSVSLFITVMLFAPESYQPEVSYLSHLYGYSTGVLSSLIYFNMHKRKFRSAEIIEAPPAEGNEIRLKQGDVPPPEQVN